MQILSRPILLLGFLLLSSCTAVDEFSPRAVTYNLAAEGAQNQALLLNVVRASLKRPMQFTTVQSVTGTASEGGTVQLTLPFGNHTVANPNSLQLTGTASGGPSFAVAVLDTQEFYQGITRPIKAQIIDYLLNEGYPRSLIFYLLTNQIDLVPSKGQPLRLRNFVGDDNAFTKFQKVIDFLIEIGLTTRSEITETSYGPRLTHAEAAKMVVAAPNAALDLKKVDKSDTYQVKKSEPKYFLCFNPLPQFVGLPDSASLCNAKMPINPAERDHVKLSPQGLAELRTLVPEVPSDVSSIVLYPRSVEAIIYFLGELARRHLAPDIHGMPPRVIQIKIGPTFEPVPSGDCLESNDGMTRQFPKSSYTCESLFFMDMGENRVTGDLAVTYLDDVYWLHGEPMTGRSLPTLALVRELLALNTSAKELPATSTLSIVAP
jgi:hypothetical protein